MVPPEWRFQDEGYSGPRCCGPGSKLCAIWPPRVTSKRFSSTRRIASVASMPIRRCWPGQTPRAQQGSINVHLGAPYGYGYARKSDMAGAYYEVIESEVAVVRQVYQAYTQQGLSINGQQGLSINGIARLPNEEQIATRRGTTRWERSTVWGPAAQPGVPGPGVLREDRNSSPTAHHATVTATLGAGHPQQCQPRTTPTGLDRDHGSGLNSAKKRSRWPKSSWSKTSGILPGARSNRPCCRGCWFVSAAATRSIAPLHKPRRASFITTGAWVPMLIVISGERFAITRRFVRTTSMR